MEFKRVLKGAMVVCLLVSLLAVVAFADPVNITIYDGIGDWGLGVGGEDQETEPGMQNYQKWDLEGFFLEDNMLTMVGGFNFMTGCQGIDGGDIFIDVDGDVDKDGNGYDFVIKMDFNTDDPLSSTYKLYSIDESAELGVVFDYNSPESDPFNYITGGEELFEDDVLGFSFGTEYGDYLGLEGDWHHVVSGIDLAFLEEYGQFWLHYTMECGNDMLRAHYNIPEPGTFSLLFMGSMCMIGFWALRRKKDD